MLFIGTQFSILYTCDFVLPCIKVVECRTIPFGRDLLKVIAGDVEGADRQIKELLGQRRQ